MIRRLSIAVLAAYWAFCVIVFTKLPDRIPMHFNVRGQADGWSDNPIVAWFALPVLATVSVGFIYVLSNLARRTPHLWNVPKKKEFLALREDQRAPIIERMMVVIDVTGLYVVVLMWVMQYGIYRTSFEPTAGLPVLFHIALWGGLLAVLIFSFVLHVKVKKMITAA